MQFTADIDEDVVQQLKSLAETRGESLSRVLNKLLRLGLQHIASAPIASEPYREAVASMGQPRLDLTKALELADRLEDEKYAK